MQCCTRFTGCSFEHDHKCQCHSFLNAFYNPSYQGRAADIIHYSLMGHLAKQQKNTDSICEQLSTCQLVKQHKAGLFHHPASHLWNLGLHRDLLQCSAADLPVLNDHVFGIPVVSLNNRPAGPQITPNWHLLFKRDFSRQFVIICETSLFLGSSH